MTSPLSTPTPTPKSTNSIILVKVPESFPWSLHGVVSWPFITILKQKFDLTKALNRRLKLFRSINGDAF